MKHSIGCELRFVAFTVHHDSKLRSFAVFEKLEKLRAKIIAL